MAVESLSWVPPHSSWSTATTLEALPKDPDPAARDILVKLAQYSRSPRSRYGRPALLAATRSAIVLSRLAGGAKRTTRTLVAAAVATKVTAQMGNIHSLRSDSVAVSTNESNYAI